MSSSSASSERRSEYIEGALSGLAAKEELSRLLFLDSSVPVALTVAEFKRANACPVPFIVLVLVVVEKVVVEKVVAAAAAAAAAAVSLFVIIGQV